MPITNQPTPITGQGINWAIDKINRRMIRELVRGTRRPSARKPTEYDEQPKCTHCGGDGQTWSGEDQTEVDCGWCSGRGYIPFAEQPVVYLIVWRGFHSVECEVRLEQGKYKEAYVTVDEGEYKSGCSIELSLEEIAETEREANEI